MILTNTQIADIVKNNPNKDLVAAGCSYRKRMLKHVYGYGLKDSLEKVKGFERDVVHEARKAYCRSNKDLFSRLLRPADKVFTARGGSVYYNLQDDQEKRARQISGAIINGISVRKWVETMWMPHMIDDPFGIIMMEVLPPTDYLLAQNRGESGVIPTYRPIDDVFDYQPNGTRLEYVVFKVRKEDRKTYALPDTGEYYRIIDDAMDYIVRRDGETVTEIESKSLVNYFRRVPAMVNSDLRDPLKQGYVSFCDDVIELAEEFLYDNSIHRVHKFQHGFPKYSEYQSPCPTCEGTGYYEGDKCKSCGGSGQRVTANVASVRLLAPPSSKDDPAIKPSEVGAYIEPSITFHQIATEGLSSLENLMSMTMWGSQSKVKTQGMNASGNQIKTATEVVDDIKPQADRLAVISEMAEARHKFIIDCAILVQVNNSYQGTSVSYGRRYLLEGPDEIWHRYEQARIKGAPQTVLDSHLNEYYEAAYQSDPISLAKALKLMYVEPFVHYTASQLKGLNPSPADYTAKLYYPEWLATVSEGMLLSMDIASLKQSLSEYVEAKQLPVPDPTPVPII